MKEKREEEGKDGKQCKVTYNHIATALQQTSYEKCASKDPRKEGGGIHPLTSSPMAQSSS